MRLFSAGAAFKEFDPRLGGLHTALRLGLAAVGLGILGFLAAVASLVLGLLLIGLAAILALVAQVLVGLFLLRLGDLSKEGLPVPDGFRIAVILYLIGIVIGILQLIAIILVYVYSGDAISRLRSQTTASIEPRGF